MFDRVIVICWRTETSPMPLATRRRASVTAGITVSTASLSIRRPGAVASEHAAAEMAIRKAIPIRDIPAPEKREATTRTARSAFRAADRRYVGVDISALCFCMTSNWLSPDDSSWTARLHNRHRFKVVLGFDLLTI